MRAIDVKMWFPKHPGIKTCQKALSQHKLQHDITRIPGQNRWHIRFKSTHHELDFFYYLDSSHWALSHHSRFAKHYCHRHSNPKNCSLTFQAITIQHFMSSNINSVEILWMEGNQNILTNKDKQSFPYRNFYNTTVLSKTGKWPQDRVW